MPNSMDRGRKYSFKRKNSYWSLIFVAIVFYFFLTAAVNSESTSERIQDIIFLIIIILAVIAYLYAPNQFCLDSKIIRYGRDKIGWDEIECVYFTDILWETGDPFIRIVPKEGNPFNIYPKKYSNSKEIRESFESMCRERSIPCHVNDRGLY